MKGEIIMKYRTEILFGDNYRDAAKVMAHETFELENTDILSTLRTTILKESPISDKLRILEEEVESGDISSDDNGELYNIYQTHDSYGDDTCESIQFFNNILDEIKNVTGKDIKYVLWLCDDKESVYNYDTHNELTDDDIDIYNESDIILSDIGIGGKLYGYETLPSPICVASELD